MKDSLEFHEEVFVSITVQMLVDESADDMKYNHKVTYGSSPICPYASVSSGYLSN